MNSEITTEQAWEYTKRMWKWVAFQKEVLLDERNVHDLKRAWLKENEPQFMEKLDSDCFFCEAAGALDEFGNECDACPGKAVDPAFTCLDTDDHYNPHHYSTQPGAFYREILRLDAIRTVAPSAATHVWKRGDIVRCYDGTIVVCVQESGRPIRIFGVGKCGGEYSTNVNLDKDATFLFNIGGGVFHRCPNA